MRRCKIVYKWAPKSKSGYEEWVWGGAGHVTIVTLTQRALSCGVQTFGVQKMMSSLRGFKPNGNGDEIDETEEHTKVCILRAHLESQDADAKQVDDFMIRRFLRARELDVHKASTMFLNYLTWKRSFMPNASISPSEIPNQLAHNKVFLQGFDKKNHPIVVVFGAKHTPGNIDEFKRFVVFTLDRICARMPPGQEKFVAIADLQGWGYSNSDFKGALAILSILQDCYPERLAKSFVVHVPYIFMTAWKAIYPLIDSKTKKKIVFVDDKRLSSTLLEDIEENQLPDIYGGKLPLVPIQDS
ncbi:Sec14p-like phosphatidylinositol transfer family protein [Euphorbia peplus]|nr:Sec14p-like phosphatidylinositol transfer family protein [Euphorbia peplus]